MVLLSDTTLNYDIDNMFAVFGETATYNVVTGTLTDLRTGTSTESITSISLTVIRESIHRYNKEMFPEADCLVHIRKSELTDEPKDADTILLTDTLTYRVIKSVLDGSGKKWLIGLQRL